MFGLGGVNQEKPVRSSSQILFLFTFGCYIFSMIAPKSVTPGFLCVLLGVYLGLKGYCVLTFISVKMVWGISCFAFQCV